MSATQKAAPGPREDDFVARNKAVLASLGRWPERSRDLVADADAVGCKLRKTSGGHVIITAPHGANVVVSAGNDDRGGKTFENNRALVRALIADIGRADSRTEGRSVPFEPTKIKSKFACKWDDTALSSAADLLDHLKKEHVQCLHEDPDGKRCGQWLKNGQGTGPHNAIAHGTHKPWLERGSNALPRTEDSPRDHHKRKTEETPAVAEVPVVEFPAPDGGIAEVAAAAEEYDVKVEAKRPVPTPPKKRAPTHPPLPVRTANPERLGGQSVLHCRMEFEAGVVHEGHLWEGRTATYRCPGGEAPAKPVDWNAPAGTVTDSPATILRKVRDALGPDPRVAELETENRRLTGRVADLETKVELMAKAIRGAQEAASL